MGDKPRRCRPGKDSAGPPAGLHHLPLLTSLFSPLHFYTIVIRFVFALKREESMQRRQGFRFDLRPNGEQVLRWAGCYSLAFDRSLGFERERCVRGEKKLGHDLQDRSWFALWCLLPEPCRSRCHQG